MASPQVSRCGFIWFLSWLLSISSILHCEITLIIPSKGVTLERKRAQTEYTPVSFECMSLTVCAFSLTVNLWELCQLFCLCTRPGLPKQGPPDSFNKERHRPWCDESFLVFTLNWEIVDIFSIWLSGSVSLNPSFYHSTGMSLDSRCTNVVWVVLIIVTDTCTRSLDSVQHCCGLFLFIQWFIHVKSRLC